MSGKLFGNAAYQYAPEIREHILALALGVIEQFALFCVIDY